MISANLLLVMIIAMIVGGATGVVLGDVLSGILLAIVCGFAGVLASAIARNVVMVRWEGLCPNDAALPTLVVVFSAIASLAGSLAAYEIVQTVPELPTGLIGLLAGLFSSVLMAMLMITYHMNPDAPENLIK